MKYYCRKCGTEMNLQETRIEGKYLYNCPSCGVPQKKKDLVDERQKFQMDSYELEKYERKHVCLCDSCDKPLYEEDLSYTDSMGRCQECQENEPMED